MKKEDKIIKLSIGNSIILITILIHLAYDKLLLTDFIAIIGIISIISVCLKEED